MMSVPTRRLAEPDWYQAGHWRREPLWQTFEAAARSAGSASLICDDQETIGLDDLLLRARRIAGGLAAAGVRRGRGVIVHSRNCIDAYAALLACFARGYVAIPLPPMFSESQIVAVTNSADADGLLLLDEERESNIAAILRQPSGLRVVYSTAADATGDSRLRPWHACLEADAADIALVDPDDDALVLYSSGSTGAPKGVVHNGNSVRFAMESLAGFHGVGTRDRILVALEFGFVGGTVLGALLGLIRGASVMLMRRWDVAHCFDLIERHAITYTLLMPTHCFDVASGIDTNARDTSSLARAILAGATPEQRRKSIGRFCGVALPMYGMSESIAHCTCAPDDPETWRVETDGRPISGTELAILDDSGKPVAVGESGNVYLRGPNRMRRYQGRPDLTDKAILEGGWFATGDRAVREEGECMRFSARTSETIRRGGIMIQPAEIELALRNHPALKDVAVVGVADDRLGQRICACFIRRGDQTFDLEAVRAYLAATGLPRYQWPEILLEFEEFPRTPSLKVRRADLARLAQERTGRSGGGR